jgi:hypothetical protein
MKVICINSGNKPENISDEEWIEEGMVYTVVAVANMGLQEDTMGFKFEEVELTERSSPYEYYDAVRFLPVEPMIVYGELLDKIKDLKDLKDLEHQEDVETKFKPKKNFSEDDADLGSL